MANVNITSAECAWANFEVKILGRTIKGLRGFGFKKEVEYLTNNWNSTNQKIQNNINGH